MLTMLDNKINMLFAMSILYKLKNNQGFLRITADSRFILFINGFLVGRGPAWCYPENQSFETF